MDVEEVDTEDGRAHNLKMVQYLFIWLLALSSSVASASQPFILEDGCPVRNPDFDQETLPDCPSEWVPRKWILAMCPCPETDCEPGSPSPSQAECPGLRGSCEPTDKQSSSPSGVPSDTPTGFPTFITTKINKITPVPTVSKIPTSSPLESPSGLPTAQPTTHPSGIPTTTPTWIGTKEDRCPQAVFIPN